jgi:hypothetical protein
MGALVISLGVLAYGYDSAFIGIVLCTCAHMKSRYADLCHVFIGTTIAQASFQRDFGINASNKNEITSHITSICSAGGLVGALLMYPFLELLGRRAAVIISDAVFMVGAIMCTSKQWLSGTQIISVLTIFRQ